MKSLFYSGFVSLAVLIIACSKETSLVQDQALNNDLRNTNTTQNNPSTGRLSYGDTLFYNQSTPGNKLANVISSPSGTTKYKAIPGGLSIDSVTGRINITQSESGIRYKIFAVGSNGSALDSVKIVISGVDYKDEIFEIFTTPNRYDTSFPIYNATPGLAFPCSDDDDDDDDDDCIFDETDLDNDGNDDIAGVIQDKLLVNIKTGTIDMEASYQAGVFGSNPANGTIKNFVMYYRMNDASGRSLQKINIRLYYYKRRSDIPQLLLNELAQRNNQSASVNARFISSAEFTAYEKPKRPPILIIVGQQ